MTTQEPRLRAALPTRELADAVSDLAEVTEWDMTGPPPDRHYDLVVPPYMSGPEVLEALDGTQVRLVQSQSIGYDGVADHLPSGVTFCNADSVHESSTAELAVGMIIASLRGFADFVRAQPDGVWAHAKYESLADKTVLVVGFGGVGQAIARRLEPFEVTVVPVASRHRVEDGAVIHGVDELPALLPHADVVVLGVPLTSGTDGLVDAEFIGAMKPGALLVNVARGKVVQTDALVDAVRRGAIRAALDVTDPEPLPSSHPLWTLDGVFITPHVGGHTTAMDSRVVALVRDQLERLRAGREPRNVVIG